MSNFRAVATVTATLQSLLSPVVGADVPGATVSALRPDGAGAGLPSTGVNVFLYQVLPSAAAGNDDLPTRAPDGRVVQRPRVGLDLHYLFTFYGRDSLFEPQLLLGSVVRTLHARPVLTRPQVVGAKTGPLAASDLDRAFDLVKLTPLRLSLEELSKLWSVFFQTAYTLSVAYQATLVLLESEDAYASPLPVRRRNVYVETFREPLVERVEAAAGPDSPILAATTVRILGQRLLGATTRAVFDGIEVTPSSAAEEEVVAALPATLRAGLHGAQVRHFRRMGTPEVDHVGVESNVAPFVLRPAIRKVANAYQIAVTNQTTETIGGTVFHSARVTVELEPEVGRDQHVALLLNQTGAAQPRAYTFATTLTADTNAVAFQVRRVRPGTYLLRVQVDGAETQLDLTGNTYSGPTVTL